MKSLLRKLYYSASPPICFDIATWAKERGLHIIETHSPALMEVQPYVSGDEIAEKEFEIHYDAVSKPQLLVLIERASVLDGIGFVKLPDGQIICSGNWCLPHIQKHPTYQRRFSWKKQYTKGDVYSLLTWWGQEFYHWFHDVLPQLEFVIPYLPDSTKFLVHEKPKKYQLDSLLAYGISEDRLEFQPNNMNTIIERLWFVNPLGTPGFTSTTALKAVGQRLRRFFDIQEFSTIHSKIYISRFKASSRRVQNENVLEPLLLNKGFSIHTCEDLTLKEQVRLFSGAESIIGPHGAGLINMIYVPNKIPIVEISTFPTVPVYFVMAKQLGHTFNRLYAKPLLSQGVLDMNLKHKDLENLLESPIFLKPLK